MKLFSKREIYRTPEELYLTRYIIIKSKFFSCYVHQFHMSDLPVPHDHPANFLAIPLRSGYLEHLPDGTVVDRKPFHPKFRTAEEFHYVTAKPGTEGKIWSLFFFGRKRRTWGFMTPNKGWVDNFSYVYETQGREEC